MNSKFNIEIERKINESKSNNFGRENYDEHRFGSYKEFMYGYFKQNATFSAKLIYFLKKSLKILIGYQPKDQNYHSFDLKKYEKKLGELYDILNDHGQKLIVELIAYRLLGFRKVKLSKNTKEFKDAYLKGESLEDKEDFLDPHFNGMLLKKVALAPIGFDIKFYFTGGGVATDFILEQYAYKNYGERILQVEEGDVVFDAGACWGDTALYFAHKTGLNGRVFSFDFIPDNMKLFELNTSFNPQLEKIIQLIPHPLSDKTGDVIYFKDNGPASQVEFSPFEGQTGCATTLTIDDFVKQNNISKVDFIKMDIEGAEPAALSGALQTIKKYRPKLAIANYHGIEDFVNIPLWILGLGLDYEIFIDHFTIHAEETVCFAKPKQK